MLVMSCLVNGAMSSGLVTKAMSSGLVTKAMTSGLVNSSGLVNGVTGLVNMEPCLLVIPMKV